MIFKDSQELLPAIIQDAKTRQVLMLGYFNQASHQQTLETGKVTFYSRSKKRLWTKGETSGNELLLVDMKLDCDRDTFLVRVHPSGPVCHLGTPTCWDEENESDYGFISSLENIIASRKNSGDTSDSYVASIFEKGINKIAQKVGEEAVEVVIEAKDDNEALFLNESADLLFHYLILLQAKGYKLNDVIQVLQERNH